MVYLLSETARQLRWSEWRGMGGCSLTRQAEDPLRKHYHMKRQRFEAVNPTLKEIGRISHLAELEIARCAIDRLKREDFVVPETAR